MVKHKKYRRSIELFKENTGEVIRIIRFKSQKDFDTFLDDFRLMRYPGYKWRACEDK